VTLLYSRFRWAELKLARFLSNKSRMRYSEDVTKALDKLMNEVGDPNLDKVYDEIYDTNTQVESTSRAIATRAYQWMMCAQRPLRITELADAASAYQSEESKRETNAESILEICSNFIIADSSNIAQFAHLSVREYLEERKTDGIKEYSQEQAHNLVAETCLAYLLNPPTPISDIEDFQDALPEYSVLFWDLHWERASENRGLSLLGELFAEFLAQDKVGSPLIDWIIVLPSAAESMPWNQYRTGRMKWYGCC
jgi:hypothetical protein